MLKPETIAVVKQTIPALQANGETLTRHFYARMFRENPEVKPYFNPAHQQAGTQQRALAGAICAYAQNIDNPAALADAVELIAQKHVSLQIKPEHYPIVGENLLAAIREVMGEAATDEVIDAWAEAYGVLADIFIQREQQIYDAQEKSYGWQGFKQFTVARREPASDNIVSFYLEPADGQPLAAHEPGQYITVKVPLADGQVAMRNYSLSNAPGTPYYRISVKREPAPAPDAPAGAVSNHLHDHLQTGDSLELGPPCGEFRLDLPSEENRPLVFIAGGVGITPILSMLHSALERSSKARPIVFIQGALNGTVHAFAEELRLLKEQYSNLQLHVRYSDPRPEDRAAGRFDSEGVVDGELLDDLQAGASAKYYFCGPKPMLQHVNKLLRGKQVPADDIHYEFFGPAEALEA
ncbi:nitric oxide dioxygenase [Methylohalomonas lacus]|uniref:Flavohemoprotein n=1 Tax=Methylohalomonas lacus TaxID=398773 RepID=A0AAE3HMI0_9GAMM|nr:NO-inducible flavohemoprotein [Methylohalomonas lacus]MCS3903208.1 nitric oxide dioxygenase [Methylohalomonas lacus]